MPPNDDPPPALTSASSKPVMPFDPERNAAHIAARLRAAGVEVGERRTGSVDRASGADGRRRVWTRMGVLLLVVGVLVAVARGTPPATVTHHSQIDPQRWGRDWDPEASGGGDGDAGPGEPRYRWMVADHAHALFVGAHVRVLHERLGPIGRRPAHLRDEAGFVADAVRRGRVSYTLAGRLWQGNAISTLTFTVGPDGIITDASVYGE